MKFWPIFVHGDISKTARLVPDSKFESWCLCVGHWGLGLIRVDPSRLRKLRRSHSRHVQQALRAHEIQQGMTFGFFLGLVFMGSIVALVKAL